LESLKETTNSPSLFTPALLSIIDNHVDLAARLTEFAAANELRSDEDKV